MSDKSKPMPGWFWPLLILSGGIVLFGKIKQAQDPPAPEETEK